jgi:GH15 family glucan-1,4-alpha-glucosidase
VGPFLERVVDRACQRWREPDSSIWEPRNGPDQFVYSKLMVWVALDRAIDLNRIGLLHGDAAHWADISANIRQWILREGYDEELQSFVQIAGKKHLDAANLLIPIQGFLPAQDRRVQNTIDRVLEELTVDDLVYRYHAPDGLPGREGAFVLCTFWLVDALTLSGRLDEAYRIFDNLMGRTNHLGLLSEQIDPSTGAFLGNFPQAYSHVGIINSALYLAEAEGRSCPVGLGHELSNPLSVV